MMMFGSIAVCVLFLVFVERSEQSPLTDLIAEKVAQINLIADAVKDAYENSLCGIAECNGDIASCRSQLGDVTCATTYGGCDVGYQNRNLNLYSSGIFSPVAEFTDEMRQEICWTKVLDETFIDINGIIDDPSQTTKWMYFGTSTGLFRIFPGLVQGTCQSYDPRVRPWYVAATSGPKDIVLVLDRSLSMDRDDRWQTAVDAVTTILTTSTITDHVAVVVFDTTAVQVCDDVTIPCNSLSRATGENIEALKNLLMDIEPQGNSNFGAAFTLAYNILDNSISATSHCHTAILFLTDGHANIGELGNDLLHHVDSLQSNLVIDRGSPANVFTFSFSEDADSTIPKALACRHNGTWSQILENENLREQMTNYYNYFAVLRSTTKTDVIWVEPYVDAVGAGLVSSIKWLCVCVRVRQENNECSVFIWFVLLQCEWGDCLIFDPFFFSVSVSVCCCCYCVNGLINNARATTSSSACVSCCCWCRFVSLSNGNQQQEND
eukprot:m.102438 g.102438  ORF g.102438 m.102438 type:complete len:493 (+) comp12592_c1_seq5:107-1585(+)